MLIESVASSRMCVFFFSSRRRHTRLVSDWSSDVCSSDLLSPRKLCKSWKRNWIFPGRRSKPAALKCINVKKINYINVVRRCLQTREEARALGLKFALGQFGARAQQAVVRPRIGVGAGTIGLNKPNTHCNFLT